MLTGALIGSIKVRKNTAQHQANKGLDWRVPKKGGSGFPVRNAADVDRSAWLQEWS
jgi:hypothetical protein